MTASEFTEEKTDNTQLSVFSSVLSRRGEEISSMLFKRIWDLGQK